MGNINLNARRPEKSCLFHRVAQIFLAVGDDHDALARVRRQQRGSQAKPVGKVGIVGVDLRLELPESALFGDRPFHQGVASESDDARPIV